MEPEINLDDLTEVEIEQIQHFLNTTPGENTKNWNIIGIGIENYAIDYNAEVSSEKWIIKRNKIKRVESYDRSTDITQKCYLGDPIFEFINGLRRGLKKGSKVNTQVLDVDIYSATTAEGATSFYAEENDVAIVIKKYAGSKGEIEYTISYSGDPRVGSVTFTNKKPVFTEAAD